MSKGLEALENIKREAGIPYFGTLYDIDDWLEDFKIIKKELKALEIVNKKRVNVHNFKWCVFKKYSVNYYNLNFCDEDDQFLNEQEFGLLKEELEND